MAYSEESNATFSAPVFLGGLFAHQSDDEDGSSNDASNAANGRRRRSSSPERGGFGVVSAHERDLDARVSGREIDSAGRRYELSEQQFPLDRTLRIRQFD